MMFVSFSTFLCDLHAPQPQPHSRGFLKIFFYVQCLVAA